MGTTIVRCTSPTATAYVGHVGDSRVYRFRDGKLEQLTEDHSLLNDYIKTKRLTPGGDRELPAQERHRARARDEGHREGRRRASSRRTDDIFLLCSDGLSGMVSDEQMQQLLREHARIWSRPARSSSSGRTPHGGNDNVTCILARCRLE